MFVFLLEYDRTSGKLIVLKTYGEHERAKANGARLDLEIALRRNRSKHEVVLLEAESEAALRATHRRYFENLTELATS